MTHQQQQEAQHLRAQGLSYQQIGARLNVSQAQAFRLVNPERARAQNARRSAAKRAWENEHDRHACACGNAMGAGAHRGNPNAVCAECYHEQRQVGRAWRMQPIYELWHQGTRISEIATELGMARGTVGFHVVTMRREGWDMPYRHAGYGPPSQPMLEAHP